MGAWGLLLKELLNLFINAIFSGNWMVSCRRVIKANNYQFSWELWPGLWPSKLSNCIGCMRFAVQTHLWTLKFVILYKSGLYHIETSPLICRGNQWTGFYLIRTSVIEELIHFLVLVSSHNHFPTPMFCWCFHWVEKKTIPGMVSITETQLSCVHKGSLW